ncbi:MAG: phage tail protein [Ferruginibacter sp.]
MNEYPVAGFHFLVVFEMFSQLPFDTYFQEVSGLSLEVDYETYSAGGKNAFSYKLPLRPTYNDLVLKRGYTMVSGVSAWMIDAFENFNYRHTNLIISLLDANHVPVSSWYVVNALPKKWDLSPFNAEESSIVIESMTFQYDYFKTLNLSSAVAAVGNALVGLPLPPQPGSVTVL